MKDLALNAGHDLFSDGTDFRIIEKSNVVAQRIKIRLLTVSGEYKWDFLIGVDWYDKIFSVKTSFAQKNSILRSIIANTPGVERLNVFNFGLDRENKTARLVFTASSVYGDVVEGEITQAIKKV